MTRPTSAPLQIGFGLDDLAEAIRGKLFLTVPEVAGLYRADQRTIRRAIEAGELAAVRLANTVRIPTVAVLRMAEIDLEDSEAASATDTATRSDLRPLKAIRHGHFDPPVA
jgi:excisionase family DNA binding protein